ncbi:tetratricopeptide repeat protein [Azospirillum sp. YIM B02556]|uniref:Tetratricopeptide repeat protein n=1 Tax=Azospirillum endophyticum TaxID=2800326 RepID=A0ABS1F4K1_9PROT|nr:tetratricopeptide repeat protein [Azospirillum endophyticum]MBK1838344.1 tetratricopeptide repeat protein [Azospirillum endophyticum]
MFAVALLFLLAITSFHLQPLHAQPAPPSTRLEAVREDRAARFALHWSGPVVTEVQRDGRELVLRFSRPLGDVSGDVALDRVPARLESWVDNILYGYDSVVLVLAAGVEVEVSADRTGAAVALARSPAAAPAPAAEAADRAAGRRIDYFRALALMEGGDVRPARTLLRGLLAQDPKDAQSTALLGQAEERLGRWREAVMAYDTALELTPGEPSLVLGKALLLHANSDRSRFDLDWQKVRNADMQRIARLSGVQELGRSTSLTWALERREVDVDAARRGDGRLEPFHGARSRLEAALVHDWPDLQRSTLSFYAAPRTLGAGYIHGWRDETSETRAGFAWSEPSFAFLEGIVDGGRRDRLFVQHEDRLSDRWSLSLGAGYNRYGLAGAADLARSATLEGSLRYTLNAAGPLTSVGYVLDAEYVGRRKERQDANGQAYVPLPAATREVHALQLNVEDQLTDYVRYAAQVGYAYDRRGRSGPQGAISLAWEPADTLELGFRASHARSTSRGTASAVNSAGVTLVWRY